MITTPASTAREIRLSPQAGPKGKCDDLVDTNRVVSSKGSKRSLSCGLLATALALCSAGCGSSPAVLSAFWTEQQAQQHCPGDAVVWVDPQTATYQLKGHGSYGLSDAGRYACRGEADRAGMRAMAN
jgi:hypothetical protein